MKAVSVSAVAAHAAGCASAEKRAGLKRVPVVSKPDGGGDPRIRGPFPILSTPFEESGAVDFKTRAHAPNLSRSSPQNTRSARR